MSSNEFYTGFAIGLLLYFAILFVVYEIVNYFDSKDFYR